MKNKLFNLRKNDHVDMKNVYVSVHMYFIKNLKLIKSSYIIVGNLITNVLATCYNFSFME